MLDPKRKQETAEVLRKYWAKLRKSSRPHKNLPEERHTYQSWTAVHRRNSRMCLSLKGLRKSIPPDVMNG